MKIKYRGFEIDVRREKSLADVKQDGYNLQCKEWEVE